MRPLQWQQSARCRAVQVKGAAALVASQTACMSALVELWRRAQREERPDEGLELGRLRGILRLLKPVDRYKALRNVHGLGVGGSAEQP